MTECRIFWRFFRFGGAPSATLRCCAARNTPRLRFKIAKKLGLTINANNSSLTMTPSIGFRYSLNAFAGSQKTGG